MSSAEIKLIMEEIKSRAEKEVEEILEKARKKAEEIIKEAEEEANKIFQHEARSQVAILRRRIIGKAEQEARRELIKAKDEILDEIYRRALSRLEDIVKGRNPDIDYKEILYKLIKEAVEALGEEEVYLKANERDLKYITEHVKEIERRIRDETGMDVVIKIDFDPAKILGGVIVSNKDRSKVYYNTVEGRLKRSFEKMRSVIGKMLFKE